jgi:hypothetical protein
MITNLSAISPVAFMLARTGDKLIIKRVLPRKNEYREKIGPAQEAFLVFKGETKIGMIPNDFVSNFDPSLLRKICRINHMDKQTNTISILIEFIPTLN